VLVLRAASPQIAIGMRRALSIAIILKAISKVFSALGFAVTDFRSHIVRRHRRATMLAN